MNTNKEAINNLVSLLVKKSGFSMSDNRAEEELAKIKESLEKLRREKEHSSEKKNIQNLIDNLRLRQSFWEGNAKILGNDIVEAFEERKPLSDIKEKIDALFNLAIKGTEDMQVGFIYTRINNLEEDLKSLKDKIDGNNYINEAEKEMDVKYKAYLENKVLSIEKEIETKSKEIDTLKETKAKDENIINRIRDYTDELNKNLKTIEETSKDNLNSEITFDVWERIEMARNTIEEKIERSNDVLTKTENMMDDVNKNISNLELSMSSLEEEKKRCSNKLNNVNNKIEKNDYINITKKMIDISKYDSIKIEIESLKNKKDVIYVDAIKVKQEIIREWDDNTNIENPEIIKTEPTEKNEEIAEEKEDSNLEEIVNKENETILEDKTEENKEEIINKEKNIKTVEVENKYELDW